MATPPINTDPLPIPCLSLDLPPLPTLPSPITIGIPLPDIDFEVSLCCKTVALHDILPFLPPIPLPPGTLSANPAIITTINETIAEIQKFFDQAQFSCPLE